MPNHITNEVIFRECDRARQDEILSKLLDPTGKIDFNELLPVPLNAWQFSTGTRHEDAFKLTGLDWARANWGTKWNAYEMRPIERTEHSLTLVFDTAWRPPYGWLCAIFNHFKISFEHNWINEGEDCSHVGVFRWTDDDMKVDPWSEKIAEIPTHRRLHKLKWGVEEFPPDGDE